MFSFVNLRKTQKKLELMVKIISFFLVEIIALNRLGSNVNHKKGHITSTSA